LGNILSYFKKNTSILDDEEVGLSPFQGRNKERRAETRQNQKDWRVNIRHYNFLDVVFDPVTRGQTLMRTQWITTDHEFRYIVTPNVDHITRIWKEPDLYNPLYTASWLSICDSRILELLAKISGIPLTVVPGSDLTEHIFDNIIDRHEAINIIGASADIVHKLKQKYDIGKINHYEPPMGLRHKPEAIAKTAAFIHEHPVRYNFICVGSPQQEMIAKACLDRGDCVGLGLCFGASLEFLTGHIKRAPKWMQNARLEWLFRLLSEPKRLWKRYLIDGPKIFLIWAKWSIGRRSG